MAVSPQSEFPILTLSNGAQVSFEFEAEGKMLRMLTRRGANDVWSVASGAQLSTPGQTGDGYIGTRGGVTTYLTAILGMFNSRIREIYPTLFSEVPSMPSWLNGEHPSTVQLIQRFFGIKLVNNQLAL